MSFDANQTVSAEMRKLMFLRDGGMNTELVACDVPIFQESYLPFVPHESHVKACIELLRNAWLLSVDDENEYKWDAFDNHASGSILPENQTFAPLATICQKLAEYVLARAEIDNNDGKRRFVFVQNPNNRNPSEIPVPNHTVIDGFFKRYIDDPPLTCEVLASEVAVVAEFEKRNVWDHELDNRLKILGAANHVMNNDPCRMFTYGITIEDTQVSVWYFSRSHCAKSHRFDFNKDAEAFISVLLSFIFATELEMGFDPTVHRRQDPESSKVIYIYEVDGRYFKTQRSISEYRSLCVTGRMTRVWEAIEVESRDSIVTKEGAIPVALKDVWLDHSAKTEKEIQESLFEDLDKFAKNLGSMVPDQFKDFTEEMKEELSNDLKSMDYKNHFLEIICDHRGYTSKPAPCSASPTKDLFHNPSLSVVSAAQACEKADLSRTRGDPTRPLHDMSSIDATHQRTYTPKQQYRLVFNQVCRALHDLTDLSQTLDMLLQSIKVLQMLYCAGWVHRDINSGNLLCFESSSKLQMVLGDLEYAKPFFTGTGSGDPKTGTRLFMPLEVQFGHLFLPLPTSIPISDIGGPNPYSNFTTEPRPPPQEQLVPPPTYVRHTFQHDIESLWWITLWCLTARVHHAPSREYANSIFQNTHLPTYNRRTAFMQPGVLFDNLRKCLVEDLLSFARPLDAVRMLLFNTCIQRENTGKLDDITSYSLLYTNFQRLLVTAKEHCPTTVQLLPVRQPKLVSHPHGVKRPRSTNTGKDDDAAFSDSGQASSNGSQDVVLAGRPGKRRLASSS